MVLHFGRMLGRGIDQHLAALAGKRKGDLAFEVEMLLAAAAQPAFEPLRRARERRHIAALRLHRRQHEHLLFQRLLDREHRLERLVFHFGEKRRAARELDARRRHGENRLTAELDQLGGEQRLVGQHRPDVVHAGNVGRRHHRDHAGRLAHRIEVKELDARMRLRGAAKGGVQRAGGFGKVVDIARFPGDVQTGAVVRQRFADAA
jgi:hypothetical protein